MSAVSSGNVSGKKSRVKKEKPYTKSQLPFTSEINDEPPIPPLSPVLCNHRFPAIELVSAEDHGLYWVSIYTSVHARMRLICGSLLICVKNSNASCI